MSYNLYDYYFAFFICNMQYIYFSAYIICLVNNYIIIVNLEYKYILNICK